MKEIIYLAAGILIGALIMVAPMLFYKSGYDVYREKYWLLYKKSRNGQKRWIK